MSIVLTCDAPGCPNTAQASVKDDSCVLLCPPGWWIPPGRGVIACSYRCVNSAVEANGGISASVSSVTNVTDGDDQ